MLSQARSPHVPCALASIGAVALLACTNAESTPTLRTASAARMDATARANGGPVTHWQVRRLDVAPERFRPSGFSREDVLWGLLQGRVARLDVRTGAITTLPHSAWSIHTSSGAVGWRNERGTWLMRDDGTAPVRLGGISDPASGFDGPPTLLISPNGDRALLGWQGEWDSVYDFVDSTGAARRLVTRIPGYYGNHAALWRKQTRVLFHIAAMGPVGGKPEYKESGWRGDLAELDLTTAAYKRVTSVPDGIKLRIAGWYPGGLLVTELDSTGVRAHWLYHPGTWQRTPTSIPKGRAFSPGSGALVVLLASQADSTTAVLVTRGGTTGIGRVPRDAEPAFSPSGRRGALRTVRGVMLFDAICGPGERTAPATPCVQYDSSVATSTENR